VGAGEEYFVSRKFVNIEDDSESPVGARVCFTNMEIAYTSTHIKVNFKLAGKSKGTLNLVGTTLTADLDTFDPVDDYDESNEQHQMLIRYLFLLE